MKKRTPSIIFIFQAIISKILYSGKKLYCAFLDYEKCFEKINRTMLWHKLITENVSSKLAKALKSMYAVVKSCVRYKNNISDYMSSDIWLKQGDPSSPLMFMMFINDLGQSINTDIGDLFTLNDIKLFMLLYADDAVVLQLRFQLL